ncbi:cytidine deaminase-like fold-containing protein, partial [Pseudomonas aeruginosa]
VIQQAYNAGKTTGADMALKVEGKAVCSYCRGDIAAAAEKTGLNSLQINEVTTGRTLYWKPGMRFLMELEGGLLYRCLGFVAWVLKLRG